MLHLRDISLRHRLLIANFTMVFVPIFILTVLGFLLVSGLRFSSPHNDLTTLWPEKGPALSIQYTVSSLRVKAERPGPLKLNDLREDCQVLESLGIATAIIRHDQVAYVTPGVDFYGLADRVLQKGPRSKDRHDLGRRRLLLPIFVAPQRDDDHRRRKHALHRQNRHPRGHGQKRHPDTPHLHRRDSQCHHHRLRPHPVPPLIAPKILGPLASLRTAASEIEKGNLDYKLTVSSRDELGQTCSAFDRMRRQLKAARTAQEKYEQNRKELIAGISHDLSTPLTLLKGYASGILVGIAKTTEKRHHYMELIYQNACSLEKLVDRLFLFSKLDLGQVDFTLETVSLRDYFADFTAENAALFSERGLILNYAAPTEAARVRIDRMQFQRVIDNLLENALKYKNTATIAMDIKLEATPVQVTLSFADHGPGVPKVYLTKLFDRFLPNR